MIGALLSSVAWAVPGMQAQAQDQSVKAPAASEPSANWWFRGDVEAGGRFFLNDPERNGSAYLGQHSLAKYYEYSDIGPGAFGNVWLATGTRDGLYQIDFGGENIGYNDQDYYLDASKAGEHYFSLGWDQTPHLYSTSALTPYQGLGSRTLTLPTALLDSGVKNNTIIVPYLNQTDLGIKRDTGSVQYRWTPTDDWDIKADYSHMQRYGTQVEGIVGFNSSSSGFNPVQVPRPVDDTTQNYGLNGEYAGTSPWGKRFNLKLAYNGSQYSDAFNFYLVQNPYCTSAGVCASPSQTPFARISTWPSNNANAFSGTLGADLPWQSRYVGKLSYTMMRQNDAFIPMTNNPNASPALNILPGGSTSLNGAINTSLSDNALTTQITPKLHNKLTYRYYDYKDDTPELVLASWTSYDRNTSTETAISSLSMGYTKQNAGDELNWRPSRAWNLGAAYGFERYNWTRADANVTNENSGKVFADWKPTNWFSVRSSGYYSERRYDNYDYLASVGLAQFPGTPATNSWKYSTAYRQLMINNRDRWIANVAVDVVVLPRLIVTPTFKYQDDLYQVDPAIQMGLEKSSMWNAGVDVTCMISPDASITVGYLREDYRQILDGVNSTSNSALPSTNGSVQTDDRTTVDTFTALARYAAIPNKLDFDMRYTLSHGLDHQSLNISNGVPSGGPFPDVTTWFQRFDATAAYTFDKAAVAQLGWKGQLKAKLHYAWEYNAVTNWANDPLDPTASVVASATSAIFMAYDNPNYNVHMVMVSLEYKW